MPVAELCRKVGISEQSFYRRKKVYGGMRPSEARELRQLREESAKLKLIVADLSLDQVMLRDVVQKKGEVRQEARGRAVLDGPLRGERVAGLPRGPDIAELVQLPKPA